MLNVSICVPFYNREKYLGETIKSILDQTYKDFELILIDDCSSDNSYKLAQSFTDPRIKLFRNFEKLGAPENFNRCIELAKGELIAIYHSDDIYEKTIVEEEAFQFQNHPRLGAVFAMAHSIDSIDNIIGELYLDKKFKGRDHIDFRMFFHSYFESDKGSLVCPTAMIPRKVYDEIGMYDSKNYQCTFDYDLYFRILEKYPIKILEKKLIKYRIHDEQDTKKLKKKGIEPQEFYKLFNKFSRSPLLINKVDSRLFKLLKKSEKNDFFSMFFKCT